MNQTENDTLDFPAGNAGPVAALAAEWDHLTIQSSFIFSKVMRQQELCLPLIQRLFPDRDIREIRYVEEETDKGSGWPEGVRINAYAKDPGKRAFTLKMQVAGIDNLPRRARYTLAKVRRDLLTEGWDYEDFPDVYVFMICPEDPFREGRHIYTFKKICKEEPSLVLKDGGVIVILNSAGTEEDVSPEILSFLKYMEGIVTRDDPYILRLDEAVQKARENSDWRREYMISETGGAFSKESRKS